MSNEVDLHNAVRLLTELRSRLIHALTVLLILFAVFMYFANDLYTLLALPLLKYLPEKHLIATQIVSPFFVPFKLAFMAAMMLGVPYFLYQLWAFIAPALYGHERKLVWPFLLASAVLFYAGLAFAYFVIFPMLFHFLAGVAPSGVILSPDISEYLDFTIKLLLVFGGLFEIPIVMVLLVSAGVVTRERLIAMRRYAIVGAFVIGMLIAPPDVLSQTILAIPVWLLYETGIFMSRFAGSGKHAEETQ
jgi:sec-independent protein translocase protein TatC